MTTNWFEGEQIIHQHHGRIGRAPWWQSRSARPVRPGRRQRADTEQAGTEQVAARSNRPTLRIRPV